jgi:flagellar biosynthetic protein FliR
VNLDGLMGSAFGFLLVVFRTAALFSVAPVWGEGFVPKRVRLGMAVAVSVPLYLGAGSPHVALPETLFGVFALAAAETVLGLLGGMCARLVLQAVNGAGSMAGISIGLGFANLITPDGAQSTVVSELLVLMTLGLAVALGVHRDAVSWLSHSFVLFPPAASLDLAPLLNRMLRYCLFSILLSVRLGFPIVAASLLGHVAVGIGSRVAPQINLANLGFTISILTGGLALYLVAPAAAALAAQATVASLQTFQGP